MKKFNEKFVVNLFNFQDYKLKAPDLSKTAKFILNLTPTI